MTRARSILSAIALVIALAPVPTLAANYVIKDHYNNYLKPVPRHGKHPVCNMTHYHAKARVSFVVNDHGYGPKHLKTVYWLGKAGGDLFVEHPGHGGCKVWTRKAGAAAPAKEAEQ